MNVFLFIILSLLLVIIIAGLVFSAVHKFSDSNSSNKLKSNTIKHFHSDRELVYNCWHDLFPSLDFNSYPDNSFSLIDSLINISGKECHIYSKSLQDVSLFTELCVNVIDGKHKNFVFKGKYEPCDIELLKSWITKLFSFGSNENGEFCLSFDDYLYLKGADCYWSSSWENANLSALLSVTGDEVDLTFFGKSEVGDFKNQHLSFSVKGINKRTGIIAGEFDCFVSIDPLNIYDPFAIKVEDHNGTLLGYLPKGNGYLFEVLRLYCNGKITGNIIIKNMYDDIEDRHYFIGIVDFDIYSPDLIFNEIIGNRSS